MYIYNKTLKNNEDYVIEKPLFEQKQANPFKLLDNITFQYFGKVGHDATNLQCT